MIKNPASFPLAHLPASETRAHALGTAAPTSPGVAPAMVETCIASPALCAALPHTTPPIPVDRQDIRELSTARIDSETGSLCVRLERERLRRCESELDGVNVDRVARDRNDQLALDRAQEAAAVVAVAYRALCLLSVSNANVWVISWVSQPTR